MRCGWGRRTSSPIVGPRRARVRARRTISARSRPICSARSVRARHRRSTCAAGLQQRGHATASQRDRWQGFARCPCHRYSRSGRMAWGQGSPSANQHLPSAAATAVTRAERTGKCLAVRAPELVVQPSVPMLRRHRRSLLRCLERTHQPAMEDHVSRRTLMGSHRSTNLRIGIRSTQ